MSDSHIYLIFTIWAPGCMQKCFFLSYCGLRPQTCGPVAGTSWCYLDSCMATSVRPWTLFRYRNLLMCLATGWHFVLLNDRPSSQRYPQHRDLLNSPETQELLTFSEVSRDSFIRTRCCRTLLHPIIIFTLTRAIRRSRPRPHKKKSSPTLS